VTGHLAEQVEPLLEMPWEPEALRATTARFSAPRFHAELAASTS
jgi:hypothetical protein